MKLDRDVNEDGLGKYAVINLRKLNELCAHAGTFQRWSPEVEQAFKTLESVGALEWGTVGSPGEFFLIKLKDENADAALAAYAAKAGQKDQEYGDAVQELAQRAGPHSPFCKSPD